MPGGVALFDYNNDGLLDIFLVNGGRIANPLHVPENFDRSNPRYWNRLYRQNPDGSFTDVTQEAGLANAGDGNYGMGVAVGDYDNDGFPDLYVTNYGKNILYHNNGDGTFTDVTAKAGVEAGGWSVPPAFSITTTTATSTCSSRAIWTGTPSTARSAAASGKLTVRPPHFPPPRISSIAIAAMAPSKTSASDPASPLKKGRALGVCFADYDDDGFTDIFVSNDGMQQYLFHNNGDGTFTECALESGAALTADGKGLSGMGTVFQDYDNDGRPDILVTVLPRELYALFHNDGNGSFSYPQSANRAWALLSRQLRLGRGLGGFRQRRLEGFVRRAEPRAGQRGRD